MRRQLPFQLFALFSLILSQTMENLRLLWYDACCVTIIITRMGELWLKTNDLPLYFVFAPLRLQQSACSSRLAFLKGR